jgi:hypothetical protein
MVVDLDVGAPKTQLIDGIFAVAFRDLDESELRKNPQWQEVTRRRRSWR